MFRDDWPETGSPEEWQAFNLRGAEMLLAAPPFPHRLKFAAFSGRLGELLSCSDVPTTELRFGTRTILILHRPVGDPPRVTGQLLGSSRGPIRSLCLSIANLVRYLVSRLPPCYGRGVGGGHCGHTWKSLGTRTDLKSADKCTGRVTVLINV
jgi:hypothetical protein